MRTTMSDMTTATSPTPTGAASGPGVPPSGPGVPPSGPGVPEVVGGHRIAPAVAAAERRPGRPRSARVDEAVVEAVIDLLAEGTAAEALSIEAIATRAGVGKATIYRRWPNKEAILVDAVASLKGPVPEIAGQSVRDDLITLLRPVGRNQNTRAARVLPCLISEFKRSPSLRQVYEKVLAPRRQLMRDVLRRGIDAGDLRPDIDIEAVMAMLVGPMVAQSVMDWNPTLDRETLPERLVAAAWPAIAVRP
jgi:AcrR family transcriptional regulator